MGLAEKTKVPGVSSGRSWAEDVNQYRNETKSLQFEYPEIKRIRKRDKQAEETAFNPILGVYRDQGQEQAVREKETKRVENLVKKGTEKKLMHETKYNVVTFAQSEMIPPEPAKPRKRIMGNYSGCAYDPISNKERKDTSNLIPNPTKYSAEQNLRTRSENAQDVGKEHNWNIVTLSTVRNRDGEHEVRKGLRGERRSKKPPPKPINDYNVIEHTYFDRKTEEQHKKELQRRRLRKEQARIQGLPEKVRESMDVNRVTGKRKDGTEDVPKVVMGRKPVLEQVEAKIKDDQEKEHQREADRRLARVGHQRFAAEVDLGYDPITNQDFAGIGHKTVYHSHTKAKMTHWEYMEAIKAASTRPNAETRSEQQPSSTARTNETSSTATAKQSVDKTERQDGNVDAAVDLDTARTTDSLVTNLDTSRSSISTAGGSSKDLAALSKQRRPESVKPLPAIPERLVAPAAAPAVAPTSAASAATVLSKASDATMGQAVAKASASTQRTRLSKASIVSSSRSKASVISGSGSKEASVSARRIRTSGFASGSARAC